MSASTNSMFPSCPQGEQRRVENTALYNVAANTTVYNSLDRTQKLAVL